MILKILKGISLFFISFIFLIAMLLEGTYYYQVYNLKPQKVLSSGQYSEEILDLQWIAFREKGDRYLEPYSATRFVIEIIKEIAIVKHDSEMLPMQMRISGITATNMLVRVLDYKQPNLVSRQLDRRVQSLMLGIWISRNYHADELLSVYLDHVYLGVKQNYGLAIAAEEFFQKKVNELSFDEALVIIAMGKSPFMYHPLHNPTRNKKRSKELFDALQKNWPEKYSDKVFQYPIIKPL